MREGAVGECTAGIEMRCHVAVDERSVAGRKVSARIFNSGAERIPMYGSLRCRRAGRQRRVKVIDFKISRD